VTTVVVIGDGTMMMLVMLFDDAVVINDDGEIDRYDDVDWRMVKCAVMTSVFNDNGQ
jgi:hypothetical protein